MRSLRQLCLSSLLASAALVASPAMAQDSTATDPPPAPTGDLDPSSPMADLPDLGVAWPDLSAPDAPNLSAAAPPPSSVAPPPASLSADTGQGDSAVAAAPPPVDPAVRQFHYDYKLEGVDELADALFRQRFNEGSALRADVGDPANAAQIDRRAKQDAELLNELMRAAGYYDARVRTSVDQNGDQLVVTLSVTPGTRYTFRNVSLHGLPAPSDQPDTLRAAFPIAVDDPVNADVIVSATDNLRTTLKAHGYPFADVGDPKIIVDHESRDADLSLDIQSGGERRFGRIIPTNTRIFGGKHIQDIARFDPGDLYDQGDVDDLKRALIQTGLVSSVMVTPVEGDAPGTVDLSVAMESAPVHTIAGELGYGTGEGARAEVSWSHRNFVKPEGAFTVRGVLGTKEQLGSASLRFNNFNARDHILTTQVSLAHTERDAYTADTFSLSATLERQTNIFFQKKWAWSVGSELVASDERDVIAATGTPRQRTYFIGALPSSINYDGTDDLLNPTRGFRLGLRFSPEVSLVNTVFGYARVQLDGSVYQPVTDRVVIAARTRIGTILGAPRDEIAPSRRFYAGGGASVRGYSYQDIGPRDVDNNPIGGRSLTEFSIEARVKTFGNFGIVPFLDAGNIYTGSVPKFTGLRYGGGIGVRYYTNFGPIRIDVGTPINPQKGDPRVAVYVSLGQAF